MTPPPTATEAGAVSPRVALYARYSSDRQSEHSIDDQIRICRAHAERQGWTVVRTFHDAAISGATTLRPGYQALQAAMRAGEVDIVLAEALDRFSRDQEHIAAFHKLVGFTRVRLVTIGDGDITPLHVGLKGTMNALYLSDLSAKTRRGIEGRVRAGRAIGQAPYGYRRVTSVLKSDGEIERGLREIVPDQAVIVQRIFAEYARGTSPAGIARGLNAEAIKGPSGKTWNPMTIAGRPGKGDGMLRNRVYLGEIVWNRRLRVKDPASGQTHGRLNPVEDHVVGLAPDLRLIEDGVWDKVQQRLAAVRPTIDPASGAPRFWDRRPPRHLLSGKLVCGVCAGHFSAHSEGYYSCNTHRRGQCDNATNVPRAKLEAAVLAILAERMMDPPPGRPFRRRVHGGVEPAGGRTRPGRRPGPAGPGRRRTQARQPDRGHRGRAAQPRAAGQALGPRSRAGPAGTVGRGAEAEHRPADAQSRGGLSPQARAPARSLARGRRPRGPRCGTGADRPGHHPAVQARHAA